MYNLALFKTVADPQEGIQSGPLCFSSRGFSLHAATRVTEGQPSEADERDRLERLCPYVIRSPLAAGKLQVVDEETLAFTPCLH